MIRKDRDHYVLSSGREIHANHGLIGVARQTERELHGEPGLQHHGEGFGLFEISEGYDGHLYDMQDWTYEELMELADFMIEEWDRFRAHVGYASFSEKP